MNSCHDRSPVNSGVQIIARELGLEDGVEWTVTYLLQCQRYIELNPVRAKMVPHPAQYHWSSYQYHGLAKPMSCLSPHPLYLGLGDDTESRCQAYQALFSSEFCTVELDAIRQSITHNYPLGGERFRTEIEQALGVRLGKCGPGRPETKRG